MTRFSTAAAIVGLAALAAVPTFAQTDQDSSESRCFPWQEYRDGRCVPKPTSPAPSVPTESQAPLPIEQHPCTEGMRNLSAQCTCPPNTHLDPQSNHCVADAVPPPSPPARPAAAATTPLPPAPPIPLGPTANIRCDGGTLTDGQCACPAGFHLMPAGGDLAGGTCIRTDADDCLGGELTVAGTCLCSGQVVMSGETYDLEYARGKCVPKRCPVQSTLTDGRCVATSAAEPEGRSKVSAPKETSKETSKETPKEASEDDEHRHHCGRGMIHTRSGCMHVHRRFPDLDGPAGIRIPGQFYRTYGLPGSGTSQ